MNLHGRDKSFLGQHLAQYLLERHDMATRLPLREEKTTTMPFCVGIAQLVVIILTVENGA